MATNALLAPPTSSLTVTMLDTQEDWRLWFWGLKQHAIRYEIWEYIDPDESSRKELMKPSIPHKNGVVDTSSLAYFQYQEDVLSYEDRLRRLDDMNTQLSQTVVRRYHPLLTEVFTVHDKLRVLKENVAPFTEARKRELRTRYFELRKTPGRRELNEWLLEWMYHIGVMEDAGLPEATGYRPQEEFLLAVRPLADSWATIMLTTLWELAETKGQDEAAKQHSLPSLVAKFRRYYSATNLVASELGSFATLGVAEQEDKHAKT